MKMKNDLLFLEQMIKPNHSLMTGFSPQGEGRNGNYYNSTAIDHKNVQTNTHKRHGSFFFKPFEVTHIAVFAVTPFAIHNIHPRGGL